MLLYYITDRKQFRGTAGEQRSALLRRISEAAAANIDYVQLREKDLSVAQLERLARGAVHIVRQESATTRILINSRTDVALAAGADGVHLTSSDISASEVRAIWAAHNRGSNPASKRFVIAVSCHSVEDVRSAESHGADFVVLAPVFEKVGSSVTPVGLDALRLATVGQVPDLRVEAGDNRVGVPVLALGGVTLENAAECLRAGASGVAAIRLFQQNDPKEIIAKLKELR